MAKIPIDEAPAGPAMDAAVAEVLGWRQLSYRLWHDRDGRERWIDNKDGTWSPSTGIAAAWELFKKLRERQPPVTFQLDGWDHHWVCWVDKEGINRWAKAQTASLAICRAFLKANGVEYLELENE